RARVHTRLPDDTRHEPGGVQGWLPLHTAPGTSSVYAPWQLVRYKDDRLFTALALQMLRPALRKKNFTA
ncbi:MAG: hypothetical protein P4L99_28960, partial [Chthoniobacter sp.]|nr:hypothetical protein [Chthoniobacter sp.]